MEIRYRPEVLRDCRTDAPVDVRAGRSDDPGRPFYVEIDGMRWDMTPKETCYLAFSGSRISRSPRRCLFAGDAETSIRLSLFVEGEVAGVELVMADIEHRFVDRIATTFLIVLERLGAELSERRPRATRGRRAAGAHTAGLGLRSQSGMVKYASLAGLIAATFPQICGKFLALWLHRPASRSTVPSPRRSQPVDKTYCRTGAQLTKCIS